MGRLADLRRFPDAQGWAPSWGLEAASKLLSGRGRGRGFRCLFPGLRGQETEMGKGETLEQKVTHRVNL